MTAPALRIRILLYLRGAGWVLLPDLVQWARDLEVDEVALGNALSTLRATGRIDRRFRPPEGRWIRVAEYSAIRRAA